MIKLVAMRILICLFLFNTVFAERIEVFVRHCHFSTASQNKNRPSWFSREACHNKLMETINKDFVNVTFFLDTFFPFEGTHFVKKQTKYPVIEVKEGTEASSFLRLINHIASLPLDPETIVYIVEDDYMHRPGWIEVLLEGFSLNVPYVTLYDHKDKYTFEMYKELTSKIFHTESCHWRTVPSTTNTYAMRFKTLLKDLDTHRAFSLNRQVSDDHHKFLALGAKGSHLVSPMPGWSTHLEPEYMSPCINWEKF